MWWKWLPWRYLVRRVAQAHGFLDPITVMARLQRFSQPAEVAEPVELLRAGVLFHARGLINSKVIQHNRDWVWPYWAERQFDPRDAAFIPRAFSITHVNLSHRNWTAVGLPDIDSLPIVDPRGLVTPLWDGWSLDVWVMDESGAVLLPSRAAQAEQVLELDPLYVATEIAEPGRRVTTRVDMTQDGGVPTCRIRVDGYSETAGWLVVSLRPCNTEGVSLIHRAHLDDTRHAWRIDDKAEVRFSDRVERHHVSDYHAGDVFIHLRDAEDTVSGTCDVGMVTAAAMFRLEAGTARHLTVRVPLDEVADAVSAGWSAALAGHCRLDLGASGAADRVQTLYDAALRTLVLHSPGDVYPGPYTYKRFWFRDAALILHALLCAGLFDRAERAIDAFPARQAHDGFFRSQDGEWDANGEVLWIIDRYCALSGRAPKPEWRRAITRGAAWIARKRLPDDGSPHGGLLPAGFSAEHLGPNDYYYWDDFWAVAGLQAAARLMERYGHHTAAAHWRHEADDMAAALDRSLARVVERLGEPAIPASPYRRLDGGAVGSLAGGYPLQLLATDDARLAGTVDYLLENSLVSGALFHDVVHSGLNAYLTLHLAQVLLRAGDRRYADLMEAVAELASPTGQWPEAIHPHTGGGCMGDGQHVWAAAEWLLMVRNAFIREEGDKLVIGAGIWDSWMRRPRLQFGPAPTAFGTVTLTLWPGADQTEVAWQADWHGAVPDLDLTVPGTEPVTVAGDAGHAVVRARR